MDISVNSLSPEVLIQAKKDLKEEFLSRIVKDVNDQGCWHLAPISGARPSILTWYYIDNGTKRICFTSRRLAFEYFKQEVPKSLAVYSNCRNKYCINPDHHYLLSHSDRFKDLQVKGIIKRRFGFKHHPETIEKISQSRLGIKLSKKTRLKMRLARLGVDNRSPEAIERCAELYYRGEKSAMAKLTTAQVLEIRSLQKSCTARELAERYPVTPRHISDIWKRKKWKHI